MIPDFDACYRAIQARDARFDGLFFVGIASTGIYCRSICSARTPKAASCRFFEKAATAEQAGFRPCLRCRPEIAPLESAGAFSLEHALYREIQDHALSGGSQAELTRRTGYSSRQVHRLMTRAFGIPPVAIAQTQRLLFAKRLLQETTLPVTRVAVDSGFGSLRRFNAAFRTRYGLSPGDLRRQRPSAWVRDGGDTLRVQLAYRPPFAWDEMVSYLAARAIPGVESVVDHAYHRTVAIGDRRGWLTVTKMDKRDCLEVTVDEQFSGSLAVILRNLRDLFDLDANPAIIAQHLGDDSTLAPRIAACPGLRVPGAWDAFELSTRAILGQQISVPRATTLSGNLVERFGEAIATPIPGLSHLTVTADALAAAELTEIAAIGMPGSRARALQTLALATVAGILDFPAATRPDIILETLRGLPGIGPWTANYIAMRAYRYPDAFPTGDLGLLRATGSTSSRDLEALAEKWRPWRAYAALHLWNTLT